MLQRRGVLARLSPMLDSGELRQEGLPLSLEPRKSRRVLKNCEIAMNSTVDNNANADVQAERSDTHIPHPLRLHIRQSTLRTPSDNRSCQTDTFSTAFEIFSNETLRNVDYSSNTLFIRSLSYLLHASSCPSLRPHDELLHTLSLDAPPLDGIFPALSSPLLCTEGWSNIDPALQTTRTIPIGPPHQQTKSTRGSNPRHMP